MLRDIFACILSEIGSIWTKLCRWMGVSKPCRIWTESLQSLRLGVWKPLFFVSFWLLPLHRFSLNLSTHVLKSEFRRSWTNWSRILKISRFQSSFRYSPHTDVKSRDTFWGNRIILSGRGYAKEVPFLGDLFRRRTVLELLYCYHYYYDHHHHISDKVSV